MKNKQAGNPFLTLLLNLIINIEWIIPAIVCLILHFAVDLSIWWFIGALIFWVLVVLVSTSVIEYAARCSSEKYPPKENKNPYSAKNIADTEDK